MNKLKLNIIGCGHLGQSLAYLWHHRDCFQIQQVMNSTIDSATRATKFIGAGVPLKDLGGMEAADVYLIATPDNQIINSCESLADSALLKQGDVVFHCSGALSSDVLGSLRQFGVSVCSVHPVRSFADTINTVENFEGTYCGVEGDAEALEKIEPTMRAIGANLFKVQAEFKTLYHAASVMVCNYLTALIESGIQTYQKAGIDRETAIEVMQPMVRGTLNNIFTLGTVNALTGPIARGDDVVLANQLSALTDWRPEYAQLYTRLGEVALQLSESKGSASKESLSRMREILLQQG